MKKSNYYDNIAPIYDQTRWLTETIAEEVADFILDFVCATPETSFLEPGVGTGLNVIPFVKRGYSVTGIDVSEQMLHQCRQKLNGNPSNLQLIQGDASQLPFPDNSFDIVLTVHMLHTISDWKRFLDEIERVLKPGGFYLNCQWITPPARKEFEGYFREVLSKYKELKPQSQPVNTAREEVNVEGYLRQKGYVSNYLVAKEWTVSNTVEELINFFQLRAYGLCWVTSDENFDLSINEFKEFCIKHYSSLEKIISSEAKFEIWAYRAV
ncbi:class I SAM-dependent methyltransferase [Fortiea sp. LEGE XX443]|uniref:class I SAM-dependent methyltransferase n=1 Tax=Fortiea sp. LEGE XX443 TaxID=1828611 RepID=UPI00188295F1|nr:class I SAM-dependent methyltransferase [Fortiea sp. LEGE XX443]MBE9005217.1 class I SAM-dependent methyltransferase [Fortiea sp. LEGE XX443]